MTEYPHIRGVLNPNLYELDDEELAATLERAGVSPEALEDQMEFWGDLGSTLSEVGSGISGALRKAAPAISKALPGVIAGASAGSALGPYGALAGGVLGAMGAMSGPAAGTPQAAAPPSPTVLSPAIAAPAAPGATPPVAPGAAGQLLALLSNPAVLQALAAMALGPLGKPDVTVGKTDVPVAAISGMVRELADQAAAEYNATAPSGGDETPAYLEGMDGDPALPEDRAARLVELMAEADGLRVRSIRRESDDDTLYDRFYDALELAEMDAPDD